MMLEEFIRLTGFTPDHDYYFLFIEKEYMNSKLEKKEWCEQWISNGGIQKAYDYMKNERYTYKASYEQVVHGYRNIQEDYDKLLKEKNDAIKEIKSIKEYVESAIDSMNDLRNSYNEVMEELNAI